MLIWRRQHWLDIQHIANCIVPRTGSAKGDVLKRQAVGCRNRVLRSWRQPSCLRRRRESMVDGAFVSSG